MHVLIKSVEFFVCFSVISFLLSSYKIFGSSPEFYMSSRQSVFLFPRANVICKRVFVSS